MPARAHWKGYVNRTLALGVVTLWPAVSASHNRSAR